MGAATGSLEWEERYRKYEPLLDATIKETIALSPEVFMSEAATETDASNIELVAMENQAFDLIRQGQREAAMALLFSKEYERHKVIYGRGMEKINSTIQERIKSALKTQRQRSFLIVMFAVVALIIVLLAWFGIVRLIGMYVAERKKTEESLKKAHMELEKKVEDRTADLQVANEQLQQEIIWRKESEEELIQNQEQLRSLASQLTKVEEQERRNIASYLHDHLGQELFAMKLQLEQLKDASPSHHTIKDLNNVIERTNQMMRDMRSMSYELSPAILYELGFEAALEWIAEEMRTRRALTITFNDDGQVKPLDETTSVLLFQAVRELLNNVTRHAKAHNVEIFVARDNGMVVVQVNDDGIGFESSAVDASKEKTQGFGLYSIKERLRYIGGDLAVESARHHGARITLKAPLKS